MLLRLDIDNPAVRRIIDVYSNLIFEINIAAKYVNSSPSSKFISDEWCEK